MENKELIKKITSKKEFSNLPKLDVEKIFERFNKENYVDEEKIKLTRELLMKVYSVFLSRKLLSKKILDKKSSEEILKKHVSTRERFEYYSEIYKKLLKGFEKVTVIDLGSGINGFSYSYFPKKVKYVGVEAVGQLVDLTNEYFKKNKISGKVIHESLFALEKIKKIVKNGATGIPRKIFEKDFYKGKKIIFLFKVIDSLEMVERNYSKKFLKELVPLADKVVISFATKSLLGRTKFRADRTWLVNFIKDNFEILDDFEFGTERYISFKK